MSAKALLLKGYAYENLLDNHQLAQELYDRIKNEYGNRILPDQQLTAIQDDTLNSAHTKKQMPGFELYQQADSLRTSHFPDSSLQLLKSLNTTYPNSYFGGKALYTIGWIYENQKVNLDSAITYYQKLIDNYQEHELYQEALGKKDNLSTIKSLLATESLENSDSQQGGNQQEPANANNELRRKEPEIIEKREAELERERLLHEEVDRHQAQPDGLPPGVARPDSLPDGRPSNQRPRLQR